MKISFAGITDTGVLRSVNQDNYYIDPEGRFFIVADGMGGHAGGQEASQIAVSEIKQYLEEVWESDSPSADVLSVALIRANEAILKDQDNNPNRKDMGTTVVILSFREKPWRAHVGDSRLYRFSQGQLEQVTHDHTWVAQALLSGEIKPEFAKVHPWRHVLCQCLGRRDQQEPDIEPVEVGVGDVFLLCSDGLTEEVSNSLIENYLHLQPQLSLDEICRRLVDSAKEAGGSDNITIVVARIEEIDETA
jgi:protein phosphatase